MVVRLQAEAVEGEDFGFLGVFVAGAAAEIAQHMDRQAAVIAKRALFKAKADISGLEHEVSALVLHQLDAVAELLAPGRLDLARGGGELPHVKGGRDLVETGAAQHRRQALANLTGGPTEGIAVGDRIDLTDPSFALGRVGVAALEMEAVELQQISLAPIDFAANLDDHPLVGVVLNVGVPLFVPDGEEYRTGLDLRVIRAHGDLFLEGAAMPPEMRWNGILALKPRDRQSGFAKHVADASRGRAFGIPLARAPGLLLTRSSYWECQK